VLIGWAVSFPGDNVALRLISEQEPNMPTPETVFRYPLWLVFGAPAFAVVVTTLAGILPARRAARVDRWWLGLNDSYADVAGSGVRQSGPSCRELLTTLLTGIASISSAGYGFSNGSSLEGSVSLGSSQRSQSEGARIAGIRL
jgi:hypothetical protein